MRNQKGFSLVEILAVIVIATSIIVPLVLSLGGQFKINVRMINKSVSTSVSNIAIQSFQEMYFHDLRIKLDQNGPHFIKFTADEGCDLLRSYPYTPRNSVLVYPNNQMVCKTVFEAQRINRDYNSDEFQVYIYPYRTDDHEAYSNAVLAAFADGDIPEIVKDEMLKILIIPEGSAINILRVIVWIKYDEGPTHQLIRTGLLSPEVEVAPND